MSRPPLRQALDSGRLVQIAFVVALVEVAFRVGLGRMVHPFLYLLAPPLVAVLGLGWLAPGIRTRVLGERRRYAVDSPLGVLPRLVVVAVIGHAVAVVVALSVFVLLDTPFQAVLYWVGIESRRPFLALAWPLLGLVLGTAVAWVGPALVAAGVSEGLGLRAATAHATTIARTAAVGPLVALHGLGALVLVLAVGVGALFGLAAGSLSLFVAVAGAFTVLFGTVPLAVATFGSLGVVRTEVEDTREGVSSASTQSPDEHDGFGSTEPTVTVPVGRLALALLLVVSLVTLAGAVRMTELRPMDGGTDLGEDPDEMYATALENTLAGSYAVERVSDPRTDDRSTVVWQLDREDRQLRWEANGNVEYVSTGTQTFGESTGSVNGLRAVLTDDFEALVHGGPHTPPNYFRWADEPPLELLVLQHEGPDGWERVDSADGSVVLELTDDEAVFELVLQSERHSLDSVDRSEARVVIDRETGTVLVLDVRFEATLDGGTTVDIDHRYIVESDVDVERPSKFGSPSPEAYVWRLLLY